MPYALFFSDYSLAKELGHDLSFIDPIKDLQKRYMAVKHYFNQFGHFQQQSFEGGAESRNAAQKPQHQPTELGGAKRVAQIAVNGTSNVPQSCSTWNVSTECRNSKKKESCDVGKWQTSNEGTYLHALESYERTRRLRQCSSGEGIPCQSLPLCWTIKMWPYPRIA